MISSLENKDIRVEVDTYGAEIKRVVDSSHIDYLWLGGPSWQDSAPNLFPFIGRFKDAKYRVYGEEFHSTIHGFIADREFVVEEKAQEKLTLSYTSTEKDFRAYPYKFKLSITYALQGISLGITYRVENRSTRTMPFGLGVHPGFNVPLGSAEKFEEYCLEFPREEVINIDMDNSCLALGTVSTLPLADKNIPLAHDLFDNDALILKDWGNKVVLRHKTHGARIELITQDFDYVTIWQRPYTKDRYVCIEPCTSIPGKYNEITDILAKEDYIQVAQGDSADFSVSFNFYGGS